MAAARSKKQSWQVGAIFLIPLSNGEFCFAQVVGREASVLNSVSIAIFDRRVKTVESAGFEPEPQSVFSVLFCTRDLLDSGRWKVVGQSDVVLSLDELPYEHLRSSGFIGAKVRGSGIVEDFVNAFYGLRPWNGWYKEDYLDDFLISPTKKPADRIIIKADD